MEDNCLFCKIVRKEMPARVIFENEHALAFLDINPVSNGHTLVIPKEHFENFTLTEEPFLTAVNQVKQEVSKLLLNSPLQVQGMNYISNQAAIAGQKVFHYHEHLIPKYEVNTGFITKPLPTDIQDLDVTWKQLQK